MTQSTKFQLFEFLVCTVWACLKGVTPYNTLKEESTNKNHCDDNYSASIRDARSFALYYTYLPRMCNIFCEIFVNISCESICNKEAACTALVLDFSFNASTEAYSSPSTSKIKKRRRSNVVSCK